MTDKSNAAPERIWAWPDDVEDGFMAASRVNEPPTDEYAGGDHLEYVHCDELDRLRAENARMMEALGLLDEQLYSHGFSVDGPMRRLISRTRAALQAKGGE